MLLLSWAKLSICLIGFEIVWWLETSYATAEISHGYSFGSWVMCGFKGFSFEIYILYWLWTAMKIFWLFFCLFNMHQSTNYNFVFKVVFISFCMMSSSHLMIACGMWDFLLLVARLCLFNFQCQFIREKVANKSRIIASKLR